MTHNAYVILKEEFENNKRTFSTWTAFDQTGAYINDSCFPGRFQKYMTYDQAVIFKEKYENWWKAQKFTKDVKLTIMSAEDAIKQVAERAIESITLKEGKITESVFNRAMKEYPAKEITEIPVYI